jgi:phospholipase C
MIAVNDEATGMAIDAISHSPYWPNSLIFVYEDDTAQGGDHVSAHRTVMLAASPWIKRGYVSKTNIDVSSLHKMIAHIYGLPYPNIQVARAGLPLDMFTSTPDFAPFDYLPRTEPLACGATTGTKPEAADKEWDVSAVDRAPGLDLEVTRWLGRNRKK